MAHFRQQGYCTLNFDHRVHGRSEDSPGELTAELLGEDAAAIIRKVFGGRKVHVLGWSPRCDSCNTTTRLRRLRRLERIRLPALPLTPCFAGPALTCERCTMP